MLCKVIALDPCFQTQAVSLGLSSWRCLCRCGRERACVCTSEGLLRDVAPVGGVLAQRERGIATPPHHCNTAGLRLNAPTTTYRISSSPAQTHTHTHTHTHTLVVREPCRSYPALLEADLPAELFCLLYTFGGS